MRNLFAAFLISLPAISVSSERYMSYDWVKVAQYKKDVGGMTITESVYVESDARGRGFGWVMFSNSDPGYGSQKWFNLLECGKNEILIQRIVLFDLDTMKIEERKKSYWKKLMGHQRDAIPPKESDFSRVVWKELCGR